MLIEKESLMAKESTSIITPKGTSFAQSVLKSVSVKKHSYIDTIFDISQHRLAAVMDDAQRIELEKRTEILKDSALKKSDQISGFCKIYTQYCKELRQAKYAGVDKKLVKFIKVATADKVHILWGNCLNAMRKMDSESIQLMVTSPPYYNARTYSHWGNLDNYLADMEIIVKESFRVLENHKAFVFNVGDITGNDHLHTRSVWGNRRIPLGAYFINIFEKCGFTFVDDFIWDKGQVESQRHKNGDTPYPMYQYPMNVYEHIMIFFKHELDMMPYPCPICGCLKVNGNAYSGVGIKSWECKNLQCFERSPANRGKRFGARSVMMNLLKTEENKIPADFVKKWRRDIIKLNPVIKINSKGENILGHTAPFPPQIPEFAIKTLSGIGERVYDPFAGSFTTAIEAQKLGRIGIGSELNADEFKESILKNIKRHCGAKKVKEINIK